jgi:tRNA threonylcarbamoyladenosine biosynthesis protein TsaE
VARALVRRAERVALERGFEGARLVARAELPRTVRFWQHLGYVETGRQGTVITLARVLPFEVEVHSADETRLLGQRLADVVRAGDLVILSGDLGAGKTTFTQGLGAGLDVRGDVTSPTFVISRVHPPLQAGAPALVHVDAYRLGGLAELDDLDLDASLDQSVTVVEWGHGLAEGLAPDRLDVVLTRGDDETDETRGVRITPVGPRWAGTGLSLEGDFSAARV